MKRYDPPRDNDLAAALSREKSMIDVKDICAVLAAPSAPDEVEGLVDRHQDTQRNVIISRTSSDLEQIINGHDPEVDHLGNRVWDRLDKMACEIEAHHTTALQALRSIAMTATQTAAAQATGVMTGVFYASGSKGKTVRADGNGGHLERGWYCREAGKGRFGPFKTKTEANIKYFGRPRER